MLLYKVTSLKHEKMWEGIYMYIKITRTVINDVENVLWTRKYCTVIII